MAKTGISVKYLAINKANAQMVGVVAAAAFITVFCLVSSKAVWSQNAYQSRVTAADNKANQQLKQNIQAFSSLEASYQTFDSASTNIIGGSSSGTGNNNGDNATIILHALPDTYDFPELASSVEKILTDRGLTISSITGTDDQVAQQTNITSPNPQPVAMPFSFSIDNANYTSVQQLVTALQQSIRPIQIDQLTLSGGNSDMTVTINAHTYYQPSKSLGITQGVVK